MRVARRLVMQIEDLEVVVEQIASLVRERRYELALALTEGLEARLATIPADDPTMPPAVRDLVQASRQLTESLITLRGLHLH
jgi:hypothetical protein